MRSDAPAAAPPPLRRAAAPYRSNSCDADGSIMPAIITAHIAHNSTTWRASQRSVIIHALAPIIGPYMSRAMTTIHDQQTSGIRIRRTRNVARWCPSSCSRRVGGCSWMIGSGTSPGERREVSVVLPAVIVPSESERVQVALRRVRQRQASGDRMARVVEKHRLGRVRIDAALPFRGHFEETARLHGELQAAAIDANWCSVNAEKLADQPRERRHRAAGLTAGDGRNCIALLGAGAFVDEETDRPVALPHFRRRISEHDERNAVARDAAEAAPLDLHRHRKRARTFAGSRRQLAKDAGTDEVAAARFEVLPADGPGWCGHEVPWP